MILTILIGLVGVAIIGLGGVGLVQYLNLPKYKDCPWCHVTMRYRASICPGCTKFVPYQ